MNHHSRTRHEVFRHRPSRPSCRQQQAHRRTALASASLESTGHHLLRGDWTGLLFDLGQMGTVITTTEHPQALLAVAGCYPEIEVAAHGLWAANRDRQLALDLTSWQEVHWIEAHTGEGMVRSIEVLDREDRRAHTIVLLSDDQAEEFGQLWENHHQPDSLTIRRKAASKASAPWQAKLHERQMFLAQTPGITCTPMPVDVLPDMFQLLQAEQLRMLMGVYTEAVIQRHVWKVNKTGTGHGWLQAWGDNAALRLSLNGLARIWLAHGRCACCGEDRWTLEAYDCFHKLVFTMQAASPVEEPVWRGVASQCSR